MNTNIIIPELGIEVEDVGEFNDRASEILTSFCESLLANGDCRSMDPDDLVLSDSEGLKFIWNTRCSRLIEAEIARLYGIGEKYFGDGIEADLDIFTHHYTEI